MSPANASSIVDPLLREELHRAAHRERTVPARTCLTSIPRGEPPGADAHERDAVAVVRIHVRLDLEDEARRSSGCRGRSSRSELSPRAGRRREIDEAVEERLEAEVGHRAAEEDRRELAGEELLACRTGRPPRRAARSRPAAPGEPRSPRLACSVGSSRPQVHSGALRSPAVGALEAQHLAALAVVDAEESRTGADRPVDRARRGCRARSRSRRAGRAAAGPGGPSC